MKNLNMKTEVTLACFLTTVIIFQPEVRSGFGLFNLINSINLYKLSNFRNQSEISIIDEAVQEMSKKNIGALIVMERNIALERYVASGVFLGAILSMELLVSVFSKNTPLHDGAVVLKDGEVVAANVYLPLSGSREIAQEYGTRHRAAVGVSECSDALVLVVSEETGDVSIALNGRLIPKLSRDRYLAILRDELTPIQDIEDLAESNRTKFMAN